jgi:hypothetical protein
LLYFLGQRSENTNRDGRHVHRDRGANNKIHNQTTNQTRNNTNNVRPNRNIRGNQQNFQDVPKHSNRYSGVQGEGKYNVPPSSHRQTNKNQGKEPEKNESYDPGKRRFFDRKINTGESFQRRHDEAKFLEAAVEYEDKVDLLSKLTTDNGLKMLRLAVTSDGSDSATFLKNHVIKLLKILGSDELSSGMRLRSVIELIKALYDIRGFMKNLHDKYMKGEKFHFCAPVIDGVIDQANITVDGSERNEEELALGWFVLKCCTEFEKGKLILLVLYHVLILSQKSYKF